jgi:hypothetical protein
MTARVQISVHTPRQRLPLIVEMLLIDLNHLSSLGAKRAAY